MSHSTPGPQITSWTHILILLLFSVSLPAQNYKANPYHLEVVNTIQDYNNLVIKDSLQILIDLERAIPGIRLDIRYATSNNFTHKQVYQEPKAYLRVPAADALQKVQDELRKLRLGLKVYDAYRPYTATLLFWDMIRDTLFVATPWKGSRHNRGCAVDVSLVDLETGKELEMPTPFDDFTEKASSRYADLPDKARKNRDLLIFEMQRQGFTVYPSEWWHFDFNGWERYPLMDLSFEELKQNK